MQRTPLKRPLGTDGTDEKDDVPLAQLVDRSKEPVVHNTTPSAYYALEGTPPQEGLADLMAAMTLLLQLKAEQIARSTQPVTTMAHHPRDPLRLSLNVPRYAGYSDSKSVATFIAELRDYQAAAGVSDEVDISRLLPVALT